MTSPASRSRISPDGQASDRRNSMNPAGASAESRAVNMDELYRRFKVDPISIETEDRAGLASHLAQAANKMSDSPKKTGYYVDAALLDAQYLAIAYGHIINHDLLNPDMSAEVPANLVRLGMGEGHVWTRISYLISMSLDDIEASFEWQGNNSFQPSRLAAFVIVLRQLRAAPLIRRIEEIATKHLDRQELIYLQSIAEYGPQDPARIQYYNDNGFSAMEFPIVRDGKEFIVVYAGRGKTYEIEVSEYQKNGGFPEYIKRLMSISPTNQ